MPWNLSVPTVNLFFNNKFCVLKLLFSKIKINVIKAGTPYTIINNELQLIYQKIDYFVEIKATLQNNQQ